LDTPRYVCKSADRVGTRQEAIDEKGQPRSLSPLVSERTFRMDVQAV
jgi:hypothetical protein